MNDAVKNKIKNQLTEYFTKFRHYDKENTEFNINRILAKEKEIDLLLEISSHDITVNQKTVNGISYYVCPFSNSPELYDNVKKDNKTYTKTHIDALSLVITNDGDVFVVRHEFDSYENIHDTEDTFDENEIITPIEL